MTTEEIIQIAITQLDALSGHIFDVISITKPISPDAAINLSKVISKLSPLLGNLIEFNTVELLNKHIEFNPFGSWVRQDPGFPDTIFQGSIQPIPGFEIKAWFPLATEITARFKDSQSHFVNKNTHVVLLAWLPEHVIYGKPRILSTCIIEGGSVAQARDIHYSKPPDYLVIEPEDTSARTRNLQQTTTNGYKWQGTTQQLVEAQKIVESWGLKDKTYQSTTEYQLLLRQLLARYNYRLDTNFAKIDRIGHPEIARFKQQVYDIKIQGITLKQWLKICAGKDDEAIKTVFAKYLDITNTDTIQLVQ